MGQSAECGECHGSHCRQFGCAYRCQLERECRIENLDQQVTGRTLAHLPHSPSFATPQNRQIVGPQYPDGLGTLPQPQHCLLDRYPQQRHFGGQEISSHSPRRHQSHLVDEKSDLECQCLCETTERKTAGQTDCPLPRGAERNPDLFLRWPHHPVGTR